MPQQITHWGNTVNFTALTLCGLFVLSLYCGLQLYCDFVMG